ncbi:DUF924 family protein [uncultured Thiothrix sp.]|jgi:uncharacterized protein (DUF924 family)|uniref:DUF924 family protein n=1 Tax=uncultured Thiothrix sp. TaxID=223185 RepID=UPI002618A230|nr:DUF924 family protein [uncultured Thiothrix sp.]HMT91722.1 DUF924 family protein [Thiolinea sp.]
MQIKDILDFWYTPPMQQHWFSSTPTIDAEIRERFENTWAEARDGKLDSWKQTAEGCLALCIVLDQFPLNMYRGAALSFSTEQQVVAVTKHALAQSFDQQLPPERVMFLYMPLMHSEHLADQDESVRLFTAAGLTENARFAEHHRGIVQRFGRFPHRNAALGRESTPAELEYLNSKEAFKG